MFGTAPRARKGQIPSKPNLPLDTTIIHQA
jgi:hypothetical protein